MDRNEAIEGVATSAVNSSGANLVNLACFEVRERVYALDVAYVREIVRTQEITPLPMSPELIEGVV